MKTDIILCGVGGQGILSIATIIGEAAMNENLYIKQAEVHGMSQRGGDVQSNLRISDKPIASDLIAKGKADVIISWNQWRLYAICRSSTKRDGLSLLHLPLSIYQTIQKWQLLSMTSKNYHTLSCSISNNWPRTMVCLVLPT